MNNDAISRSAVLSMMDKYIDMARDDEMHHAMCCVAEGIGELPALDVQPVVHAYWKKTYDLIDGHDGYECSACGYTKYFDHYAEGITLCKPFCCNCGARMDGEEET